MSAVAFAIRVVNTFVFAFVQLLLSRPPGQRNVQELLPRSV